MTNAAGFDVRRLLDDIDPQFVATPDGQEARARHLTAPDSGNRVRHVKSSGEVDSDREPRRAGFDEGQLQL